MEEIKFLTDDNPDKLTEVGKVYACYFDLPVEKKLDVLGVMKKWIESELYKMLRGK